MSASCSTLLSLYHVQCPARNCDSVSHGHTYCTSPAHILLTTSINFVGAHAGGTAPFLHRTVIVVLQYVTVHEASVHKVLCVSRQRAYVLCPVKLAGAVMSQQILELAIPWNSTWRVSRMSCAANVKPCTVYDKATVLIASVTFAVLLEWGTAQV